VPSVQYKQDNSMSELERIKSLIEMGDSNNINLALQLCDVQGISFSGIAIPCVAKMAIEDKDPLSAGLVFSKLDNTLGDKREVTRLGLVLLSAIDSLEQIKEINSAIYKGLKLYRAKAFSVDTQEFHVSFHKILTEWLMQGRKQVNNKRREVLPRIIRHIGKYNPDA